MHELNCLRAACAFGDKGSLFVSAMIFSCFLQGKTKVYCTAYYLPMLLRKQREKGSSLPGLSISISRYKVVLGQVHALHEMRPISFRGASYAMDLCNEPVRRKPGRCDLRAQPMRRNPGAHPMGP